jgi:hypothetical protein
VTTFLTLLAAALLSLGGLQIVESIRNGHQLLMWAWRADSDMAAVQ